MAQFIGFHSIFSVPTLLAYLRNFDASTDIYLGERYGYQLLSRYGFNYITGGAGIVFSLSVIEKLVDSCRCPAPTSPDDMILALCLQRMDVEPMHSSRFHQVRLCHTHTHMVLRGKIIISNIFNLQARPIDYPKEVLLHNHPISFHKFWQMDPYFVYEKWLHRNHLMEKIKYQNGIENAKIQFCNTNQNEFCHENSFNKNDWLFSIKWKKSANTNDNKTALKSKSN